MDFDSRASMQNQSNASRRVVGDGITIMSQESLHGTVLSVIPQGDQPYVPQEDEDFVSATYNATTGFVEVEVRRIGYDKFVFAGQAAGAVTTSATKTASASWVFSGTTTINVLLFIVNGLPVAKWVGGATPEDATTTAAEVAGSVIADESTLLGTVAINGVNSSATPVEPPEITLGPKSPSVTDISYSGGTVFVTNFYDGGAGINNANVSVGTSDATHEIYLVRNEEDSQWLVRYEGSSPLPSAYDNWVNLATIVIKNNAMIACRKQQPLVLPLLGITTTRAFYDQGGQFHTVTLKTGLITSWTVI